MKLLAIDGNSIINRAFYGIKLLSTKDGRYTNAVYGFINILNRLLESEQPDGVAVAFDLHAPTFRHKEYDAYKAGRRPTPPELLSQFPILKDWLTLAGYHVLECEGFEADDILGTLATSAEQSGNSCVIATGDRDALQLVSDSTRVLLTVTKMGRPEITDYTPEALFQKYGLTPPEMIELKALMGDSSDNIPGVAGVGEKTATDLIMRYHSLDYIYEHIDELEIKEGVRTKLRAGRDSAFKSRWLGTICRTAPIGTDLGAYLNRERDLEGLSRLMTSLEFFKLMEKMGLHPVSAASAEAACADECAFTVCEYGGNLPSGTVDLYLGENGFAYACGGKITVCDEDTAERILCNADISKRVYDSKPLYKRYPKAGGICFDLRLAGYLCNPSSNDYEVERLLGEYDAATPTLPEGCCELATDTAKFSAACDAVFAALKKIEGEKLLCDIEIPLARVLAQMEEAGFLIDREGLINEGSALEKQIEELTADIYTLAGGEFNINSPKQLGVVLFEKLGIPAKKKTKSGYSTNAEILEELRYNYPIVDLVLKYRRLAKLKSTYCDGLLTAIGEDGRLHSTFNQTEARTGRISSLEPNLQNIPVRTEEGRRLRRFFKAKDGYVLCDADYSQIELRVLASIANDEAMISAFESGVDIHTSTASQVFNIPIDMVLPIMRSRAKAVNFGIVYGIGAFSLAKDIGVSRAEADRYIKGYLATYKGVDSYMKSVIENAKRDGFVLTLFGRRRYLPELASSNGMMRAFGERAARNAPIQGTAADIIKIAMINVSERLQQEMPEARLILQVHDELIVEAPRDKAQAACKILEEEMENAASLKVKLSVDANSGENWLEAKG